MKFNSWKVHQERIDGEDCNVIRDVDGHKIGIVNRDDYTHLVATAPKLFEALQKLVETYIEFKNGRPCRIREIKIGQSAFNKAFDAFEEARAALAEAKGEKP